MGCLTIFNGFLFSFSPSEVPFHVGLPGSDPDIANARIQDWPGGWNRNSGLPGRRNVWASFSILPQAMPRRSEMSRP